MKHLKLCFHNWAVRVYRWFGFPIVKLGLLKKHVVFGVGGYADRATCFEGDNYVGQNAFLSNCNLGRGTYVGDGSRICDMTAGRYCSVGFGVTTAIGTHPVRENISTSPSMFSTNPANNLSFTDENLFDDSTGGVKLGNDVWIGNGAVLLGGITVGDGAVIGAGSVVTKPVDAYGIYVGCPAKCVGKRFDDEMTEKLLALKWWDKDDKWLRQHAKDFANPGGFEF